MKEHNSLRSIILELLYKGESEAAILNEVVMQAQKYVTDSVCSILCVDAKGRCLQMGSAPDLPDFYVKAVNGTRIKYGVGSCGTSAFTGERVVVEDIHSHPFWIKSKYLAQKANLRSCWSEPIKDPSGKVLGTFAIYHHTPTTPTSQDLELISELTEVTAIVLDRYQISRQLEESENKYRILADASNEAMFILDGDEIIEMNKRAESMTGYSKLDLAGLSIFHFIAKEYWITSINSEARNFRDRIKAIIVTTSDEKVDVVVRIKNSFFKGKKVCLLSVRDVTSYKNVKTQLLKLSQSVIQSPASIMITDFEGAIEFVNPKFINLTGYTFDEVKGRNPRFLNADNMAINVAQDLWGTIKSGKEWNGEFHNKKKNGELFWERAIISPIKDDDGEIINFIAVKEDITERKRQEQVQKIILNISNAVFSKNTLVEFIHFIREELSAIIDTTNFFVALYDDVKQIFFMPYHDDQFDSYEFFPKGKTLSAWVVDHEKPLLGTVAKLKELEESGEVELHGEPSKIWLGMPLRGKEKIIGVLVIQSYEDEKAVTEEDRDVLELVSHQISISIEQKRTEQELQKALRDATESDRLKSVFLATMSHELRTPLNAIIGFSELVDHETPIDLSVEYCKLINQSGLNLLNIVEDLFDVSLIQSGAVKVYHKKCSLSQILNEIIVVIRMEQQTLGKQHVSLNLMLPEMYKDLVISTDSNRFKQIFLNLLKNAMKFTDSGSIEFGVCEKDRETNAPLTFYVKDTGVGIPEEKKDNIFGMFRQANESLSRTYNGVGIGLSISKSLTELLGGKIWFESKLDEGTTFYFTHPVN